jgi:voltage-gated potassium channel
MYSYVCCLFSRLAGLLPEGWDERHSPDDEEPELFPFEQWLKVLSSPKKLIDLATVVPFWVLQSSTFNFIRVLRLIRLLRILHIFKISKDSAFLGVVDKTIRESFPVLALMTFITFLSMVFFGSLILV